MFVVHYPLQYPELAITKFVLDVILHSGQTRPFGLSLGHVIHHHHTVTIITENRLTVQPSESPSSGSTVSHFLPTPSLPFPTSSHQNNPLMDTT
jgi:hypothetical protein